MPTPPGGLQTTTSYKVVLPFYFYGTVGFLVAAVLLFFNTSIAHQPNFNPPTLALTHTMALAWATMIILGASHQLLPVVIEARLYSDWMAHTCFAFFAVGIPLIIVSFYYGNFGWPLQTGAVLVNIGVLFYLLNVFASIYHSDKREVHAWFMAAASVWLFSTTLLGLFLAFGFTKNIFNGGPIQYLALHAHMGIIGWFLTLITGVGSRLIPLFMISKYKSDKTLWGIFILINAGLLSFIGIRLWADYLSLYFIPIALVLGAIILFIHYCLMAKKVRIRKKIDHQVKTSFVSLILLTLPVLLLLLILSLLKEESRIIILYGYTIFFGWITAIILGMTYKTLPFIVWNKLFSKRAAGSKPPAPKDLFSEKIFNYTIGFYFSGFLIFFVGVILLNDIVLKIGAAGIVIGAALYVFNTNGTIFHKS